jgi:hypothetical protein
VVAFAEKLVKFPRLTALGGALMILAGVALIAISAAILFPTLGASAVGSILGVFGGGVLIASGAGLFARSVRTYQVAKRRTGHTDGAYLLDAEALSQSPASADELLKSGDDPLPLRASHHHPKPQG